MLKVPNWLGDVGKRKWKELRRRLPAMNEEDADTLALLCKAWERYLSAEAQLDKEGSIQANGRPHASVAIASEARKVIVKLSHTFGLSPDNSGGKTTADPSPLQQLIESK